MKKWHKVALGVVGTLCAMYGVVYLDVVTRAKEAYYEGEKYWNWTEHPDQRAKYLDEQMANDKAGLEAKFKKGELTKDELDREIELLAFDYEQQRKESTMKYAYVWYQTVVEQFSPPESKWVQLARQKMPQAKERWKAELRAKNIPFEDYMID